MNEQEFNWCIEKTLFFGSDFKPLNMILDDGGDLTNLVLDSNKNLINDIREFLKKPQQVKWTYQRYNDNNLSLPAINVNDSVTKSNLITNMVVEKVR